MEERLVEVEKKVAVQEVLVAKFDTALDKISEVSLNVSKLLAVHEQRIEVTEITTRDLHSRVSSSEQRLRREMSDGQKEILEEIKSLREDIDELGDDLESDFAEKIEEVSGRVSKLERAWYYIIGGTAVIGFLLAQVINILFN